MNTSQLSNDILYVCDQCTKLRKNAGKSQLDMVEITGMSLSTIYRIESGQRIPDLEQLFRYCYALNISLIEFLPLTVQHVGVSNPDSPIQAKYKKLTSENKELTINAMCALLDGLLSQQTTTH